MAKKEDKTKKIKGVAEAPALAFEAQTPAPVAKALSLKVRRIGNSLGVILPQEVLARLKVTDGEHVVLTETANGYAIAGDANDTAELMRLAEGIMQRRRKVLKALAQ
jgi:putative addiction module antidote